MKLILITLFFGLILTDKAIANDYVENDVIIIQFSAEW